jgi:predicted NAD/FAD-dependent oxidoreductase
MDFSLIMSGLPTRCSAEMGRLMRRLICLVNTFMSKVCLAVLRAIIAGVVFTTCAMVMMHYLGLPLPVPSELFDKLESLGQLARILS